MTQPPEDTTPAPTAPVLCSAWATRADLPDERPDLDDAVWDDLLMFASEVLWALSGRRWYGRGCTETAHFRGACACCGAQSVQHPGGDSVWWVPRDGEQQWAAHRSGGLKLPRDRVDGDSVEVRVNGVLQDGVVVDPTAGIVYRQGGCPWMECEGDIAVSYGFGTPPPLGGKLSAVEYALELGKGRTGDAKCQLPRRVQSITRQGTTITMLDPGDFLDQGRTGVLTVDTWLRAVNPKQKAERGRVIIPGRKRALRR